MWLIKHKDEIEKMLEKPKKAKEPKDDKNNKKYSIAGVPDFQKEYVNDLLSGKLKDN